MSEENPTAGDSGASIEDRLERMLPAEPAQQSDTPPEAKPEGEAEEKTDKPESGDPEQVEQPQLTTAELAKILGVEENTFDLDADGNIQVKTKIDGKDGAAKFTDLVKNYQLQGHAENRAREAAEKERAVERRMQEVEQTAKHRLDYIETMANVAHSELMRDSQQLEQYIAQNGGDPGQIAHAKLQIRERGEKLNAVFNQVGQHKAALSQHEQTTELSKLPTLIPEWQDQSVAEKEITELKSWIAKNGYTLQTAGHIKMARDAMRFERQQQARPLVENKVRTAPKIVKSGSPATDTKDSRLTDLKQQVRKSGGKGGSLEALLIAKGIA